MKTWFTLYLSIQIITGIFSTIHYRPNIELAFNRVNHRGSIPEIVIKIENKVERHILEASALYAMF